MKRDTKHAVKSYETKGRHAAQVCLCLPGQLEFFRTNIKRLRESCTSTTVTLRVWKCNRNEYFCNTPVSSSFFAGFLSYSLFIGSTKSEELQECQVVGYRTTG